MYCFNCGEKLREIQLAHLECEKCLSVFLPFVDKEGHQNLMDVNKENK